MKNLSSFSRLFLLFAFTSLVFFSCDNSGEIDPNVVNEGPYSKGVFIINEGNFGSDNSSISFYYPEKDSIVNNIFFNKNGRKLGNTTQSMVLDDTLAYIVVNVSNKLEVVSANTFLSKGGIEEGLSNPRYFARLNDNGYITNWGDFTDADPAYIAKVDLNTMQITDTIQTGSGPENILALNNKIYFTNNFGNTLGILDPQTLTVKEIELASSPAGMVEDAEGKLWVIASGDYQANNGKLFRIDLATETVEKTIELGFGPKGSLVMNGDKNQLFYLKGKSVYEMDIASSSAPSEPLITNNDASGFYGVGYNATTDQIYIGDANGFLGTGTVYKYKLDGTVVGSFDTGVGPNGFAFKL